MSDVLSFGVCFSPADNMGVWIGQAMCSYFVSRISGSVWISVCLSVLSLLLPLSGDHGLPAVFFPWPHLLSEKAVVHLCDATDSPFMDCL